MSTKFDKFRLLVTNEITSGVIDSFAVCTGTAVLNAFLRHKRDKLEEKESYEKLYCRMKQHNLLSMADESKGGTILCRKTDLHIDEIEEMFYSRHSVRDFDDTDVDEKLIKKAVQMALRCPSACNRQSTKIYVISAEKYRLAGLDNAENANKHIILTGDISAFSLGEFNDWQISTAIFAAYLTLTLHTYGIGSCIRRKTIYTKSIYNEKIRKLCNIPDNEQIVLELIAGNYKKEYRVACSNRKQAEDVMKMI